MKLTKGVLAAVVMMGGAWGQNPTIINNVQNQMTAVQQKQAEDSNAALGIESTPANGQAKKPSPAATAPAVKAAPAPMVKSATATKPASVAPQPAKAPTPKAVSESAANNKLEDVKVIRHADNVQIEMSTREAVTPTVDKLTSPDRVVVQLPATAVATEKSKIAVGEAGIKGVRIGVNGKTPPTTSVVVDLDHAINYEISGSSNKVILTLQAQGATQVATAQGAAKQVPTKQIATKVVAAPAPAVAKVQPAQKAAEKPVQAAAAASAKKAPVAVAAVAAPKQTETKVEKAPAATQAVKTVVAKAAPKPAVAAKPEVAKAAIAERKAEKVTIAASKEPAHPAAAQSAATQNPSGPADDKAEAIGTTADASKAPKPEDKKWAMNGKRDPFFSPIVQQPSGGSGCSTGKKCLEIGQINVRGIVKSQDGFIAVVTNSLNKAYFLHENDPVFNGFVLRITGDSVVFQESYQDKLGKPLTREVTKTVVAPAV